MKEYNLVEHINPNIFRGYDIRAIYGKDLDENVAYTIGLAYGAYLLKNGYDTCVIGHDNRDSSEPICEALLAGITRAGKITINTLGLVTTPMYYFAQMHLNHNQTEMMPGIMITASHNPKEYNGMKLSFNDFGNACGQMIQDFRVFVEENTKVVKEKEALPVLGCVTPKEIRADYLALVKEAISLGNRKIKVVVDTANGTASIIAKEMYEMFDLELIPLYMESDARFPNHHPDPSVEANNADLKKMVLATGADLGIGIDGDADRVGIIDEKGNMIYIDFYAIIVWRDIMSKVANKNALFDVKCSKSLPDEIIKLGGNPVCYRTGNSYMKAKMREGKFAFGSELSGHVFFNDKWPNIDDGLYAGLRLIEILSKGDKTVSELLEGINHYYSTPEMIIPSSDEEKFKKIEMVKEYCHSKGYNINDIDGVRAEFSNGWALVRASNTGPNITARFEGKTEADKENIQKEFMSLLEE